MDNINFTFGKIGNDGPSGKIGNDEPSGKIGNDEPSGKIGNEESYGKTEVTTHDYTIININNQDEQLHIHKQVIEKITYFKGLMGMHSHPAQLLTENFSELCLIICTLYDPKYFRNYIEQVSDFTFDQLLTIYSLFDQVLMPDLTKNEQYFYDNFYSIILPPFVLFNKCYKTESKFDKIKHEEFHNKILDLNRVHLLLKINMPVYVFNEIHLYLLQYLMMFKITEVYPFIEMKDDDYYLFPYIKIYSYLQQNQNKDNFQIDEILKMKTHLNETDIKLFIWFLFYNQKVKINFLDDIKIQISIKQILEDPHHNKKYDLDKNTVIDSIYLEIQQLYKFTGDILFCYEIRANNNIYKCYQYN